MMGEAEKFLGFTLIIFGMLLITAGTLIYLLPYMKEFKLIENPLIIFPLKKNGFLIGFSPLILLILLILYLVLYLRYS